MNALIKLTTALKFSAVGALLLTSGSVLAWGKTGHRVSAQLAEQYLSEETKAQVATLFPDASLAEIATYADENLANTSEFWQKTSVPWHWVTIGHGTDYLVEHAPEQGDAYTALLAFRATLNNPDATREEKRLALYFTVHIIGDLHQPMHVGNGTDRGGNDVKVEFFWQDSNLHRVWDSGMIDGQKLSYTEWTDWLTKKITPQMAQQWQQTDPKVWMKESATLRNAIYPRETKLSWSYQYQHLPALKTRLQQAGVRIAAFLNENLH